MLAVIGMPPSTVYELTYADVSEMFLAKQEAEWDKVAFATYFMVKMHSDKKFKQTIDFFNPYRDATKPKTNKIAEAKKRKLEIINGRSKAQ